jgi:hypothetical protein
MHIADHYDLAFQHFAINQKFLQLVDDDQLDDIDELVAALNSIEIETNLVEECLNFAENKQILIEKIVLFANKIKNINKKLVIEKNYVLFKQYGQLQKNVVNKILFLNKNEPEFAAGENYY